MISELIHTVIQAEKKNGVEHCGDCDAPTVGKCRECNEPTCTQHRYDGLCGECSDWHDHEDWIAEVQP